MGKYSDLDGLLQCPGIPLTDLTSMICFATLAMGEDLQAAASSLLRKICDDRQLPVTATIVDDRRANIQLTGS